MKSDFIENRWGRDIYSGGMETDKSIIIGNKREDDNEKIYNIEWNGERWVNRNSP